MCVLCKEKKHYTLVELVVTVSIIAILMSILFSIVEASKQRAQELDCSGNLKAISSAFYSHSGDYGYFPGARNTEEYSEGAHWFNALAPYLGYNHVALGKKLVSSDFEEENPFTCKTARSLFDDGYYDEYGGIEKEKNILGYGMNAWTHLPRFNASSLPGKSKKYSDLRNSYKPRPGSFRFPSLLPLIGDSRSFLLGMTNQVNKTKVNEIYEFDRIRHAGRGALLFADGKVLIKPEEYWTEQMKTFMADKAFFADTDKSKDGKSLKSFD